MRYFALVGALCLTLNSCVSPDTNGDGVITVEEAEVALGAIKDAGQTTNWWAVAGAAVAASGATGAAMKKKNG